MSVEQIERALGALSAEDAISVASAGIVVENGESTSMYPMFEVREITPEGAFLAGSLFLEVGETVTVGISWTDGQKVQARARVVSVSKAGVPGMRISFSGLEESGRELIQARATRAPQ